MRYFVFILSCVCNLTLFSQESFDQKKLQQLSIEALKALYEQAGEDIHASLAYAQALATKSKQIYGTQDTLYGLSLIKLGMQHYYWGNYQQTIDYWTTAKNIFEQNWGTKHTEYINILANIALLHYYLGAYKISEKLTLEVKKIRANTLGKKHQQYGFTLNNMGLLYWRTGRYELAEQSYLEAQKIIQETVGSEHEEYANVISNLASLYYEMGRSEEVEPLFLQTKRIIAATQGVENQKYVSCLTNLAALYLTLERSKEAERLYLEAQEINQRTVGKEHPEYSTGLHSLGLLYFKTNRLEEGLGVLLEAKKILETSMGKEYHEYLAILNSLGLLYLEKGDNKAAYKVCMEARTTSLRVFGNRHPIYFRSLNTLASIGIAQKDYAQAWAWCRESIEANTGKKDLLKKIDEQWVTQLCSLSYFSMDEMEELLVHLYFLMGIDATQEQLEKQVHVATLAVQLLEKKRQAYIGEKDQLRLLSQSTAWTHRAIKSLSNLTHQEKKAFWFAESNKSVLLYNAIQTKRAYVFGGLPDSLVWQEKKLQEEKASLKAALVEKMSEDEFQQLQKELAAVNWQLSDFKTTIEKQYPKYSELKYQQSTAKLEDIQALIDEETAVLEYVVTDSLLHIFYVDYQKQLMHSRQLSKQTLTKVIKQLHEVLSGYKFLVEEPKLAHQIYVQQAHWLYQQLLEPVLRGKKHIKNLLIVTDGELGHLPFETFLVEDARQKENYQDLHYLINDYTISYAYSATLWRENLKVSKRQHNHKMLALAADYHLKDSMNLGHLTPTYQILRKKLKPIENAQQEVKMLEEHFDGEFWIGTAVSEQLFRQKAKDYGILHLAMHGVLNRHSPALSALAFSESNEGKEDNFLQAYEISQLDLTADLVVLSACETGYGQFEEGNGIASLARSFMYAGVPSMVVSLWQVNDLSTKLIMKGFYNYLKQGWTKAAALRQAKLDYLAKADGFSAHPAFWSPFIQLGAVEPIALESKTDRYFYMSIALLVCFVGGVLYKFKKEI